MLSMNILHVNMPVPCTSSTRYRLFLIVVRVSRNVHGISQMNGIGRPEAVPSVETGTHPVPSVNIVPSLYDSAYCSKSEYTGSAMLPYLKIIPSRPRYTSPSADTVPHRQRMLVNSLHVRTRGLIGVVSTKPRVSVVPS